MWSRFRFDLRFLKCHENQQQKPNYNIPRKVTIIKLCPFSIVFAWTSTWTFKCLFSTFNHYFHYSSHASDWKVILIYMKLLFVYTLLPSFKFVLALHWSRASFLPSITSWYSSLFSGVFCITPCANHQKQWILDLYSHTSMSHLAWLSKALVCCYSWEVMRRKMLEPNASSS